jgi:hypothetical protein
MWAATFSTDATLRLDMAIAGTLQFAMMEATHELASKLNGDETQRYKQTKQKA